MPEFREAQRQGMFLIKFIGEKYFLAIFWWNIPNKRKIKNKYIAKQPKIKGYLCSWETKPIIILYEKKRGHLHSGSRFVFYGTYIYTNAFYFLIVQYIFCTAQNNFINTNHQF